MLATEPLATNTLAEIEGNDDPQAWEMVSARADGPPSWVTNVYGDCLARCETPRCRAAQVPPRKNDAGSVGALTHERSYKAPPNLRFALDL